MKKLIIGLTAGFSFAAIATAAHADTVSYMLSDGPIPFFDTTTGTLDGVSAAVVYSATGGFVELFNPTSDTQPGDVSLEIAFNFGSPELGDFAGGDSVTVTEFADVPQTTGLNPFTVSNFGALFLVDPFQLSPTLTTSDFEGPGSWTVLFQDTFTPSIDSSLTTAGVLVGNAGASFVQSDVMVTYDFTPSATQIPAPLGIALLPFALGGLYFASRQKNRRVGIHE